MPVPPTRVGGVGSDPTAPARDAGAVLVPAGDVGDGLRTAQPTEPASYPEQFPGLGMDMVTPVSPWPPGEAALGNQVRACDQTGR